MIWLAVDGEAIDGKYCLLADNSGRHVLNMEGLGTKECFEFLLASPAKTGACFGLNYDANNWLVDLPEDRLKELWETGEAWTRKYHIQWLPGKWFRVKDTQKRDIKICEVWGFFQAKFVEACRAWGFEVQDELDIMKSKRGSFSTQELERVISYCVSECKLLSELMDKLEGQCNRMDLKPKSYIGAGSIASALMSRENLRPHHAYDNELTSNENALEAIMRAYFGGRVEMFSQGITREVSTYDLNSAYPTATRNLPSLDGATVRHIRHYKPNVPAIWRVQWEGIDGAVMPFPVRVKKEIFYPKAGEGVYHAVEVDQAIASGYPIEVLEGWILKVRNDAQPFSWVQEVYNERRRLKNRKDFGEKVLKLGLNSVYGKTAQGQGYKGAAPPWQSYWWAGAITAFTRAAMLRIAQHTTPLMIATDGVFLPKKVRAGRISEKLGDLSYKGMYNLFVGQPGVYHGYDENGKEILKSRGFFARDVNYDDLREGYEREGLDFIYQYDSTRFIGLGVSLQKKSFQEWRQWITSSRAISLRPRRKAVGADGSLSPIFGPLVSEVYIPKKGRDEASEDHEQGMDQPMRD